MNPLWGVTLIGLAAGCIGTGLGGLIVVIFRMPKSRTLSFVLGFSGGIMLAVVFQDLIPESLNYGTQENLLFGFLLGCALLFILDRFLPHAHVTTIGSSKKNQRFVRTSILIGIGIALHNFPEGLAIGAGYSASESLGISLAIVLAFHDMPEGMAMAGPMQAARLGLVKIVWYCALSGVPTGLGALIGSYLGSISGVFLSIALGFAAGAMLYLVFDELLPIAYELDSGYSATFGSVFGVVAGMMFLHLLA